MAAARAGTLELEIIANVARLQSDMRAMQSAVGMATDNIARSFGNAGGGVNKYAADVLRLKSSLDPTWAAQQKYNRELDLGLRAMQAGAITREQFIAHNRAINAELKGLQPAMQRVTGISGNAQAGMRQLGFQMNDVATQFASGTKASMIFAQQSGQVIQAVQMMIGGTSQFATFMQGPWGIALTVATVVMSTFVGKMLEGNDEAEKGKKAHQGLVDVLRDGKSSWGEITQAAADYAKQQARTTETTLDSAKAEAAWSSQVLFSALAIRKKLEAQLQINQSQFEDFSKAGAVEAASIALGQRIDTQTKIDANAKAMVALTAAAAAAQNKVAGLVASLRSDPSKMVAEGFDQQRKAVNALGLSYDEQVKRLTDISKAERAAADAAKDHTAAQQEYGREINLQQAKAIAQGAGLNVTSGLRTRAEQQWLYDHKRTAQNPVALPGTSAHESGNALDIGFGPGVTVASIKKAYDDMGVHLTKVLIETGHFHIEWATKTADGIARAHEAAAKRLSAAYEKAAAEAQKRAEETAAAWVRLAFNATQETERILGGWDAKATADLAPLFPSKAPGADEAAAKAIHDASQLADAMERLKQIAGETDLGAMFGKAGSAMDNMASALERLADANDAYATAVARANGNAAEMAKADAIHKQAQLNGTLALLHGAKSLFSEQSAAYKALDAMEKIAAARALVNTAIHVAAGAAKMFASLGPFAFPVVAAMMAVMAGLGFSGGSSTQTAPPTAQALQDAAGTGSVLGDSKAKSNSIGNSLDIIASNTNNQLEYSNKMLAALQSIQVNISKLSGNVAQQIGVSGSLFDTSKLNLGSSGSGGFLGMFATSTQRSLWDAGLKLVGSTVGDIVVSGVTGQTYQIVQQIKKNSGFLGLGGGTKTTYETTTGTIDPSITGAIQAVIISLRDGLVTAAGIFGIEGAAAIADNFRIDLGTISFKDMTGAEIETQLNAIFSKVGDDMAGAILPSLTEVQKVGEGLFETFTRVAREYQVVDTSLKAIGMAFGAVGVASIAARDELVQLFGGLDQFASATSYYRDNFLTEAERMAPIAASVADEMARLNLSGVDTIDKFKSVVGALDLTTQAGRDLFAALMSVAPAFATVEKYQQKLADDAASAAASKASQLASDRRGLEIALLQAQGRGLEAVTLQRLAELEALDESLRPLKMSIYAWQDVTAAVEAASSKVASAQAVLSAAYDRQASELTATAQKWRAAADSLRTFRNSLNMNPGGSGNTSQLLIDYLRVAGGARAGNESDVSALPGTAGAYLSSLAETATTLMQYQRGVAMVRRDTDAAIAAAEGRASAADMQLDLLKKQVSALVDIGDKQTTVAEAIAALEAAQADLDKAQADRDRLTNPVPQLELLNTTITDDGAKARDEAKFSADQILDELRTTRAENAAMQLRLVDLTAQLVKFWNRTEVDGIQIRNDATTPIYTSAV